MLESSDLKMVGLRKSFIYRLLKKLYQLYLGYINIDGILSFGDKFCFSLVKYSSISVNTSEYNMSISNNCNFT